MTKKLTEDSEYTERAKNSDAFLGILNVDEALGPIGIYHARETKSNISAVDNSKQGGGGGCNPIRMSLLDYFIDVERVFDASFGKDTEAQAWRNAAHRIYILGMDGEGLDKKTLYKIVQAVGSNFRKYKLFPSARYFVTLHQKRKTDAQMHENLLKALDFSKYNG